MVPRIGLRDLLQCRPGQVDLLPRNLAIWPHHYVFCLFQFPGPNAQRKRTAWYIGSEEIRYLGFKWSQKLDPQTVVKNVLRSILQFLF